MLADPPGGGKTIQMTTKFPINRYNSLNVTEVKGDRARGDYSRHLPADQDEEAECLSAKDQPIACYCVNKIKDLYLMQLPGTTVVIAPKEGVDSFLSDIKKPLDGGEIMKHETPYCIAFHVLTLDKTPGYTQLTKDEMNSIAAVVDFSEIEKMEKDTTFEGNGK